MNDQIKAGTENEAHISPSELNGVLADETKQDFVAKQFRETIDTSVETRTAQVTCGCGLKMPLRFAYRCLYCGEYYCQHCAEIHFGKTRAQYNAEKAANIGLCG